VCGVRGGRRRFRLHLPPLSGLSAAAIPHVGRNRFVRSIGTHDWRTRLAHHARPPPPPPPPNRETKGSSQTSQTTDGFARPQGSRLSSPRAPLPSDSRWAFCGRPEMAMPLSDKGATNPQGAGYDRPVRLPTVIPQGRYSPTKKHVCSWHPHHAGSETHPPPSSQAHTSQAHARTHTHTHTHTPTSLHYPAGRSQRATSITQDCTQEGPHIRLAGGNAPFQTLADAVKRRRQPLITNTHISRPTGLHHIRSHRHWPTYRHRRHTRTTYDGEGCHFCLPGTGRLLDRRLILGLFRKPPPRPPRLCLGFKNPRDPPPPPSSPRLGRSG
jgi:hypothetical protein